MLRTIGSIYSLLAATAVLLLGSGLLGTVVALRAGMADFPRGMTGLVMSGFFVGYVAGSYLCPPLIRAFGHIRSFSAFAAIGCATVILHGLWISPLVWLILRVITGIAMLGMYLVIESWLNSLSTAEKRGRLFAVYMAINLLALGLGQYLLLIYDVQSLAAFALSALFFSLALVPIALTRMLQPSHVPSAHLGMHHLYATSPLSVLGALISGLVSGAFWGLGPIYALNAGFDQAGIALFMSGVIFGGALLQWPLGHLSDHHDRRLVILGVSLAAGAAALGVYVLVDQQHSLALLAAVLFGGCVFSIYPLCVAHANDHLDTEHVLETSRGLLLLSGIGAVAGPLLAGLLMEWIDSQVLMIYFAAMMAVLATASWWRRRVGIPISTREQGDFVVMARTSPAVLELDPRLEAEADPAANGKDHLAQSG
jgi:MFS family permease